MTTKRSQTFGTETWRRGHRGLLSPANTNRPSITNMRVYPDGSLGPRPRWRRFGQVFGGANGFVAPAGSGATIWPMQYTLGAGVPAGAVDGFWVGNGTSLTHYQVVGPSTAIGLATLGTYQGGPRVNVARIGHQDILLGFNRVLVGSNGLAGFTDANAALLARFFTAPNTFGYRCSTIHQGRAYYSGDSLNGSGVVTQSNRVYYSDAYLYAVFSSASQFFDVDGDVAGMASVGPNLLIWTKDSRWYILQGRGDPANGTLSFVGVGPVPHVDTPAAVFDNSLVFLSSAHDGLVVVGPGGAIDDTTFAHIAPTPADSDFDRYYTSSIYPRPAPNSKANTILVPFGQGSQRAVHLSRDTWTYEEWNVPGGSGVYTVGSDDLANLESLHVFGTPVASNWALYTRPAINNAPEPVTPGEVFAEAAPGAIGLPRIADPSSLVRVEKIIVDGKYWKGASYDLPPAVSARVDHGADAGGSYTTSFSLGPASRSNPAAWGDGVATPYRLIATPTDGPMPYTHFCDVVLSGLQNMTVDQVDVLFTVGGELTT